MALFWDPVSGTMIDDGAAEDTFVPGQGSAAFGNSFWDDIGSYFDTLPTADYSNEGNNYPTVGSTQGPGGSPVNSAIQSDIIKTLLRSAKGLFTKPDGSLDMAALSTAGAGLYQLYANANKEGGYNKPVPKMDVVREQVKFDDANRRPGSAGRQYFTDPRFVAQGDAAAIEAAKTASAEQASGIRALQPAQAAPAANPWAGKMNLSYSRPAASAPAAQMDRPAAQLPQIPEAQGMAHGGIAHLAKGGRYLSGSTDGMADKLPANIDGKQPAKLSHGEFVIPADVVSHLGNGNSDAGAKKLYEMMARVRKARTGNEKQGKQIDPNRFMPGGIVGLASGGEVKAFQAGGQTGNTGTTGPAGIPLDTSRTSTLSPWVGDYVTNALGQGAAMAAAPYQAYTGPLTAGPSNLQQQAFAGASEIAQTGFTPTQFSTGTFDAGAASRYMNPYLQSALNPQLAELKRQAEIKRVEDAGRLTRAGAFGGSRQAIMESEGVRNMLDQQRRVLGEGYATAYDKAMAQFNAEQNRQFEADKATEASRRFGGEFGLKSLDYLSTLGKTQRDIEAEGLAADKAQFEEQRDFAYKMPQYQLNLLQGLPIGAQTSSIDQSGLASLMSNVSGLGSLYKQLAALGQTQTPAPATPKP